jgi:hypothetical protein
MVCHLVVLGSGYKVAIDAASLQTYNDYLASMLSESELIVLGDLIHILNLAKS